MSINTQEARVNVFLRIIGLVVLSLGAVVAYLTYSEASQANLVPQIVPVFYLGGGMLIIVGALAVVANYK